MRTHVTHPRFISCVRQTGSSVLRPLIIAAIFFAPAIGFQSALAVVVDPLANGPVNPDLFNADPPKPVSHAAYLPHQRRAQFVHPANYQTTGGSPTASDAPNTLPVPAGPVAASKDPCAAVQSKPLGALVISIAEPAGKLPTDLATPCWDQINSQGGGCAVARCWPVFCYQWEATCLYYNPLYFEEANLERYGYQCGDRCCCCTCGRECCLQPAASAAHFFGTIPALPYCLVAECPRECVYTLGNYRPGDCNPWRWQWPPCDPVAAVAAGGIWTGLIFAIP